MSSSSSDEDEQMNKRLLEAASEELIGHMSKKQEKEPKQKKKLSTKPSLRNKDCEKTDHQFELSSTPEFKAHIAKKLSSYLDGLIDTHTDCKFGHNDAVSSDIGGIKLLKTSKIQLKEATDENVVDFKTKRSRIQKRNSAQSSDESSDDEQRQKFASVCVTGNNILDSGEGAFQRQQKTDNAATNGSLNKTLNSDKSSESDDFKTKHKKKKRKKLKTVDT